MVEHLVRSYEDALRRLKALVTMMSELTKEQLDAAVNAAQHADASAAERVIEREPEADRLEHQIHNAVIQVLALRQPVAVDLRQVLSALQIAGELERICDHAENMARRLLTVYGKVAAPLRSPINTQLRSLLDLGHFAVGMVKDSIRAYIEEDADLAQAVWNRDKELDEMYSSLFRELLTYMMEDPQCISAVVQALFVARDIERVGDRATNIAEAVRYLIFGVPVEEERPKANTTKSMTVPATT